MNSSPSTLNPNAASYVPISKREVTERKDSKFANTKELDDVSYENYNQEQDGKFMDLESEMDLAYLQMNYPGVSDQSVADVYAVNHGDFEAAVEMLNCLLLESPDIAQDALDIERPKEPVTSGECSSVKVVSVTGESSSSARPSDLAVAT